jgi:hypothetical protein
MALKNRGAIAFLFFSIQRKTEVPDLSTLVHDVLNVCVYFVRLLVIFIIISVRKRTRICAHEVVKFLLICDLILLLLRLQESLIVAAVRLDATALKFDLQTSAGA